MKVGALGDIVFQVSDSVVQTLSGFNISGSSSVSKHSVHLGKALTEFTGADADSISFNIRVSKVLGADPDKMFTTIADYNKNGKAVTLTIGTKKYGYKWLITKYKMTAMNHDGKGNIFDADFSLTLQEYAKG